MGRWALAILAVFVNPGCVPIGYLIGHKIHTCRLESSLQRYVGKDTQALASGMGPPSRVMENGSGAIWSWQIAQGRTVLAESGWISSGVCEIWFDVASTDVVTNWHWRGDC